MGLVGLFHRQLFPAGVHHVEHVGQILHALQAADASVQLGDLPVDGQLLLLGEVAELAAGHPALQVVQVIDALLDGLPVGQGAPQPADVHVGHAGALGFLGDGGLGLALGADEQDGPAFGGQIPDQVVVLVDAHHGLVQIDDVDAAAFREDEGTHLRVPAAGAVPKVHPSFQQLPHGYNRCHGKASCGLDRPLCSSRKWTARCAGLACLVFLWPRHGQHPHFCGPRACGCLVRVWSNARQTD